MVRLKDGRALIVEIKADRAREDRVEGEQGLKAMQLREWERLKPGRVRYWMIFADGDLLHPDELKAALDFIPAPAGSTAEVRS